MFRRSLLISLFAVLLSACGSAKHDAAYSVGKGVQIRVELDAMHSYLAEFNRVVVLVRLGHPPLSKKMFPDTGGYGTTNLYQCQKNVFMLKGYFDSWIVNTSVGSIEKGRCKNHSKYLGAFGGINHHEWRFSPASEKPEKKLQASTLGTPNNSLQRAVLTGRI